MEVNWDHIKVVWETGGNLIPVVAKYGLTVPEVSLMATKSKWEERGSANKSTGFSAPVLTDHQVTLAHKTDLGRLRLFAACVIEGMVEEKNTDKILKDTERLAKIYAIIIPLERKVFGLDVGDDDAPHRIEIVRTKK